MSAPERADLRERVEAYFALVRAEDPRVAELFHPEGRVRGLGIQHSGRSEIEAFYRETFAVKRPAPSLVGPMLVEGSRVAAELSIEVADGPPVHVVDLFEFEGDLIRSLTYFVAEYPAP